MFLHALERFFHVDEPVVEKLRHVQEKHEEISQDVHRVVHDRIDPLLELIKRLRFDVDDRRKSHLPPH
jgi:hypothetical protein